MTKKTLEALAAVTASTTDLAVLADARRMERRLTAIPMKEILDLVPGETLAAKARNLRITRTTIYSWLDGLTRPRRDDIIARVVKATGLDADVIRGKS